MAASPSPSSLNDPQRPSSPGREAAPDSSDALGAFAPTGAQPPPAHQTSIISDVVAATRRSDDSSPTLPSFECIEAPPEIPGIQILGVLGRGGMGVVYKGLQTELGRVVAVKMILSAALADPVAQRRFLAEAKAIAQLQHPHVVGIYEVGKHQGSPYFVLEFLPGGTLAHQIGGKPRPPREAAERVERLARGMHAAHGKGIVHRDLKPLNILLAADGTPKITDFGLAKQADDQGSRTKSGEIVGTPNYMAPEQIDNRKPGVGPLTDVYALGAILYELLTGRPPFQGVTPMETLLQALKHEAPAPSRLNQSVPADLETICLKCLRKEPAKRYADAEALADDLKRFLNGEPIKARPISGWERGWRWCRRNPAVAALSGTLLALLVAGLAVVSHLYLKADRSLAEAKAKFAVAREAVDKLTTAGDTLLDASDIPRVRQEMLQEGLEFYQEFLRERGDDPELMHQTGKAQLRVGDIYYQLGRLPESEETLRQATETLEAVRAAQPANAAARFDLALAWKGYGITLANLRRFKESEEAYRQAKSLAEGLTAESPLSPHYRKLLGDALNNLGLRLIAQGRLKEAEEAHWRALEIREQLLKEDPLSLEKQLLAASMYANYAMLLAEQGRLDEAEQRNLMALEIRRRAVELQPAVSAHRKMLADTHLALADLYARRGLKEAQAGEAAPKAWVTAEIMFKEGLRVRRNIATDHPTVANHRRDYANAMHDYGVFLVHLNRTSDAALQFRLAAELWAKTAADFPQRPDFQRRARLLAAYLRAREGDPQGLAAEVEEALARSGHDGEPFFFAARTLALAAGRDGLNAETQDALARQAIAMLRQSWSMDYFRARWRPEDLDYLPEFSGIRRRAECEELLSSLKGP